jgi:ribonuclease-3
MVQDRIGYTFGSEELLLEALTHPSAVKEGRSHGPDNQRLEYLGDAVLQLAVSHMLLLRFPESGEGDLSFMRAEMVRRENLAEVASTAQLPDLVIVGPSLGSAPSVARDTVAADALEALLGAVYLDGGWERSVELVNEIFTQIPEPGQALKGSKSALQEIIQGRFGRIHTGPAKPGSQPVFSTGGGSWAQARDEVKNGLKRQQH